MHTRAIAVSTLWQIASQAVMAVLSAITVKFVAIGLSQELAGAYNSAYGYLQIFAILADFGLYAVSINELSKSGNKERVLGALLTIRVFLTLLSLGASVLIAWMIPVWSGTPLPIGITIAVFVPFFTLLAGVLRTVFQIGYSMHLVFIAEVVQRLVTAALMGFLIYSGIRASDDLADYRTFLWVGSLGSLILFILSCVFAMQRMRIRPVLDWPTLKPLIHRSLPYGAAFLCIALYRQVDLTMIALLRDDFALQNARYGFALRVAEMAYLVPTFLLNSTLPLLGMRSASGDNTSKLLGKTLLALLLLGSFSSIFAFLWARPLMHLFTDTVYLATAEQPGADTALMLLSPSMFLNTLILFSFYTLLAEHRWKTLLVPMAFAAVFSVVLNLFLIPTYGFTGAAITLFLVHFFLALFLFPSVLRGARIFIAPLDLGRWALFSLGIILIAILLLPFLTTTTGTILSGAVALILIGVLTLLLRLQKAFF